MKRPIRVLQVIQNLNYGGMERLLADIVRELDAARFQSDVLALGYLGRFAEGLERYAGLHLSAPMSRLSLVWPRSLAGHIRRLAPDVVHLHSGVWYKASLAARLAGVPRVIFTEHGRATREPWLGKRLDWLAARRTDVVVAVSQAVADRLRQEVVPRETRVDVIQNGIDVATFTPQPDDGVIRREFGIEPDCSIVGSIGRLEPIKGYDVMIRAFALVLRGEQAGPAPVLLIAGGGSEHERLLALARELGIAGRVILPGWRDDIHALHRAFSIFAMSSRSEGTSVSLLEAMSAGLCPVVTDVGGNRNVLGEELSHRLVPSENPEAFAAALRTALEDASARVKDGAAGRRRVADRFSLRQMVEAYGRLYEEGV